MKPAKRLLKFGIWFVGPQTSELFNAGYIEPKGFDHVVVGTGESRAVAAARALSHMRDLDIKPVREQIEQQVQVALPLDSTEIEAPEDYLNMYCVIGLTVERE